MFELNGYQLPDFPSSGYPYAMISFDSSGGCAYLTFVDKVGYIKKNIIDNVWYGNAYTLGLTTDMAHDESKVIYEESYVVMLDEAYKDALELLYPGINKTSWLRYTPSSKQTPSGGYYSLAMNYGPQWANFTLYDEDGNLFFSAEKKFPLRTWIGWLLTGLCSRPLPVSVREPVAYLYNGVRLPKIPPEIAKYPYIAIWQEPASNSFANYCYLVGMSTLPNTWKANELFDKNVYHGMTEAGEYRRAGEYPDATEWTIENNVSTNSTYYSPLSKVKWANYDVLDTDGTTYLAASAPIPVYE